MLFHSQECVFIHEANNRLCLIGTEYFHTFLVGKWGVLTYGIQPDNQIYVKKRLYYLSVSCNFQGNSSAGFIAEVRMKCSWDMRTLRQVVILLVKFLLKHNLPKCQSENGWLSFYCPEGKKLQMVASAYNLFIMK